MILAALILQAAAPQSAVDAERAFNAAAQAKGQWTAFREFAAKDAVMFVPQPVNTHTWLRERDDPPKSVTWWPTESYVSCDGKLAVNTGGWKLPDGSVGYFSTVWQRQADGSWKWIVDGGDGLKVARDRPAEPKVVRSACTKQPSAIYFEPCQPDLIKCIADKSLDGSLVWDWTVKPDGARTFTVRLWNGGGFDYVIKDVIPAPAQ